MQNYIKFYYVVFSYMYLTNNRKQLLVGINNPFTCDISITNSR